LFINPDSSAARPVSAIIDKTGLDVDGNIQRVNQSTAPEYCKPALRIRIQATVITAG